TRSTGYNKSTRGVVIDPKIPCYQVSELASLNNNRYRTLGSSFILSKNRTLTLEVVQDGNNFPIIGLANEAYSVRNIKRITVSLSDKVDKTVKLKNNSYWDRVKRTFLSQTKRSCPSSEHLLAIVYYIFTRLLWPAQSM